MRLASPRCPRTLRAPVPVDDVTYTLPCISGWGYIGLHRPPCPHHKRRPYPTREKPARGPGPWGRRTPRLQLRLRRLSNPTAPRSSVTTAVSDVGAGAAQGHHRHGVDRGMTKKSGSVRRSRRVPWAAPRPQGRRPETHCRVGAGGSPIRVNVPAAAPPPVRTPRPSTCIGLPPPPSATIPRSRGGPVQASRRQRMGVGLERRPLLAIRRGERAAKAQQVAALAPLPAARRGARGPWWKHAVPWSWPAGRVRRRARRRPNRRGVRGPAAAARALRWPRPV